MKLTPLKGKYSWTQFQYNFHNSDYAIHGIDLASESEISFRKRAEINRQLQTHFEPCELKIAIAIYPIRHRFLTITSVFNWRMKMFWRVSVISFELLI